MLWLNIFANAAASFVTFTTHCRLPASHLAAKQSWSKSRGLFSVVSL